MKNVAYVIALAAGVVTLSGCCDWFCKKPAQAEQAAESKALADNSDVAAPTEAPVEETTATEATQAPVEEVNTTVAQATPAAMPMNEVATEQKAA